MIVTEVLGQDMNTRLEKAEAAMQTLKTTDLGKHVKLVYISLDCKYQLIYNLNCCLLFLITYPTPFDGVGYVTEYFVQHCHSVYLPSFKKSVFLVSL